MSLKNGYVKPFKLFDNVYYVGDKWVSSYAVTTSEGIVLIDTLDFPYSKWIPNNLKSLGFDSKDIKYIIITHGHSDHVGGAQYLQSLSSSNVLITKEDYELAKAQSINSKDGDKFNPPIVEKFTGDNSTLVIGDTAFKFYVTPGHTKGCLSIEFEVKDNGQRYRAFVVGGMGTNFKGINLAKKYLASIERIRKLSNLSPKVSVNLANHPHMNHIFENRDRKDIAKGANPYVDQLGFQRFLDELEMRGLKKYNEEIKRIEE